MRSGEIAGAREQGCTGKGGESSEVGGRRAGSGDEVKGGSSREDPR